MKYLMGFTGSFVVVCLIISAMYAPTGREKEESKNEATSSVVGGYRLGEENGRIAAFRGDSQKAFYISERRISDLPVHDAELLRKGITADNEEQLKELEEEYCS